MGVGMGPWLGPLPLSSMIFLQIENMKDYGGMRI